MSLSGQCPRVQRGYSHLPLRGKDVQSLKIQQLRRKKPGEEGLLRQVAACEPDLVLVRNLAGLSFYRTHFPDLPLVGDYSLNVANKRQIPRNRNFESLLNDPEFTRLTRP